VIQGVIKESPYDAIALRQSDGKLVHIPRGDIESQKTTDISLMPENLQNGVTLQEFADVIDYLASLKLPDSAAAIGHGMPATIVELEKPVPLVPFSEQKFEHPCWFGPVPGVPDTFAVVEHETGKIWLLKHNATTDEKSVFLETGKFQTGTRGLVSLIFHPNYAANGRYFYVKEIDTDGHHHAMFTEGLADASRLHDSGQPPKVIFNIEMTSNYHYGSAMAFGPDGYFYVGVGDTGPQGDPNGNAQNMSLIKGKMLRIDVDHVEPGKTYSIPSDNPFVNDPKVRPEIWAYGLRMPWRISFDPLTGDLWEGEVGQDLFEEVNILHRGVNYGWNVIEGFSPFSNKYKRDGEKYVPPIFAYSRKYGASCTGGFVYRASRASSFYGVYIFGDYQSSRLFGLTQENGVLKQIRQIALAPQHAVSIGRGEKGELYLVGYEGTIYKIDLEQTAFK
jgi:glucose/arabinose dehydrogenase